MKLVDMKLPKRSKKELENMEAPMGMNEQDRWPYGLQIRFEKEEIKKLPSIVDKQVGDKCVIYAEATITSVRQSERRDGSKDHTIEMQIEKIDVKPKITKALKDMNPKEYKEYREQ